MSHDDKRPAYLAPPVPPGHVRVRLWHGDYDTPPQWDECLPSAIERSPERIFDIPAATLERWRQAYEAFYAASGEIDVLFWERGWTVPPGWKRVGEDGA